MEPSLASQLVNVGRVTMLSCHWFVTSLLISRLWNSPAAPSPQGGDAATCSATTSKTLVLKSRLCRTLSVVETEATAKRGIISSGWVAERPRLIRN